MRKSTKEKDIKTLKEMNDAFTYASAKNQNCSQLSSLALQLGAGANVGKIRGPQSSTGHKFSREKYATRGPLDFSKTI